VTKGEREKEREREKEVLEKERERERERKRERERPYQEKCFRQQGVQGVNKFLLLLLLNLARHLFVFY